MCTHLYVFTIYKREKNWENKQRKKNVWKSARQRQAHENKKEKDENAVRHRK